MPEHAERLHDLEAVMERLPVGRSSVFKLLRSGQLRSVRIGRRRFVSESAIVQFIENLEAQQRTDEPCEASTA